MGSTLCKASGTRRNPGTAWLGVRVSESCLEPLWGIFGVDGAECRAIAECFEALRLAGK